MASKKLLACPRFPFLFDPFSEHLLGERLTVVPEFHSHLEPMKRLRQDELDDQITFSYINYNGVSNALDLPGPFPADADPTRYAWDGKNFVPKYVRRCYDLIYK